MSLTPPVIDVVNYDDDYETGSQVSNTREGQK